MLIFGNENRSDTILFVVDGVDAGAMRWYEGIKIYYMLSGSAQIHIEKNGHTLSAEDFLVVNAFEPHYVLMEEGSSMIELRIPLAIIERVSSAAGQTQFDCDSTRCTLGQKPHLASIRRICANLFRAVYKGHMDNTAYIFSEVYALLDLLTNHFSRGRLTDAQNRKKNAEQLRSILSYINEHFRDDLSIHDVAQANYLTANYLSRYFQRMLGTTFTSYLTSLRLGSAYSELVSTSKTITQIALDNGFRSTNAFIKYFKDQYGDTPGKLRHEIEERPTAPTQGTDNASVFQALLRHASKNEKTGAEAAEVLQRTIQINTARSGKPLVQRWKNLINIGYASEGLQANVQEQLRRIQREIGFRYVRFQGLLDDDMLIYSEDENGHPELDFTLVDLLFDFLLSIGLRPYIEFGFVPALLADPKARAFRRGSYLCLPTNPDKWMVLVEGLVLHWEERYGREELCSWYFTPMSINCMVSDPAAGLIPDYGAYTALYRRVYRLLKGRNPAYRVSGPGVYSNAIEEEYLWDFLADCAANDCMPDQFTILCFPYDPIHDSDYFRTICAPDLPYPDALSPDEQYVSHMIDTLLARLTSAGFRVPELAMIEWNSTMWQRDLCNDSCFKSAYLVKNIAENYDRIWGMGYWTANEMIMETPSASLDFHGGYGLFTTKGIPKSAYLALQLLNRMGNRLLYADEGCMVTTKDGALQILLYHYCHYDELYRHNYLLDPNAERCYDRFVEKGSLRVSIELTGLERGTYSIRRYRLGRTYGSAFDRWIDIGLPPHLNKEEVDWLKAAAQPDYHVSRIAAQESMSITAELAPHDVQLITVSL